MFLRWRAALAVDRSAVTITEDAKTCRDGQTRLSATGGNAGTRQTREFLKRNIGHAGVNSREGPGPKQRCLVGQTLVFLGAGYERFCYGRDCGMLERHRWPLQRNLQHFIHRFYKMHRKSGEDLLRDFR